MCNSPLRSDRSGCLLARDHDTSTPARSASAGWRMNRFDTEAAACDQPGDHGVRVPHLASLELVAPPHRRGRVGHEFKDALREKWVVCQPLWAVDRLLDVRDDAITPSPDLIPEDAQRASPVAADCPFGDDSA